ncbi:methyl-accepting chemotaxis protein [Legionella sp. D16C41]|uniref:methyl-accepting chemotaxis protein n=1 Tax=Legionella sp. D16C41 TaxID=3402688 RepID=UPI003AF794A8
MLGRNLNLDVFKFIKKNVALLAILIIILILMLSDLTYNYSTLQVVNILLLCFAIFTAGFSIISSLQYEKASREHLQDLYNTLDAISKSQAIIELAMDGTIITANENFLNILGYTLDEIKGKHHSIFLEKADSQSNEYKDFWATLKRGEHIQAEFKRLTKDNNVVWLLASYNPIKDNKGKPIKVIKVAADITQRKEQTTHLEALSKKLKDIGLRISKESNEIAIGVKQLESTVSEQVTSASEQAAAVTQISTTIEEIKATTNQTQKKAKELGESADLTTKESEKGREAVATMATFITNLRNKMQQISTTILSLNDKTQQISEITEAVADIAKQSKMLALNASIEAAKAGESGKGFAVVAGEVKDLAERSQQSTQRVQKILQDIRQTAERAVMVTEDGNKSVEENSRQVELTEGIINSLGNVIEETSLASMQIVSAVREESVAIDQVDLSIKEINKVTNLFISATEQTRKATTGLRQVADSLRDTASQYELTELQKED